MKKTRGNPIFEGWHTDPEGAVGGIGVAVSERHEEKTGIARRMEAFLVATGKGYKRVRYALFSLCLYFFPQETAANSRLFCNFAPEFNE